MQLGQKRSGAIGKTFDFVTFLHLCATVIRLGEPQDSCGHAFFETSHFCGLNRALNFKNPKEGGIFAEEPKRPSRAPVENILNCPV